MSFHRILVPVDFSEYSRAAIRFALKAADGDPSRLYLLHVVEPYHPSWKTESAQLQRECRAEERAKFDELVRGEFQGGKLPHMDCEAGHPLEEILKRADQIDADLIVVGTKGRSGLSRVMIGSVAERIVRYSKCPVIVVR